ncbi:putative bifunctional diguanylate cyclase/phosphodiesterase [Mangrovimicrobium sediminis]|nr:EAL domain-containing protein [Haliea sp. SAOS-164]
MNLAARLGSIFGVCAILIAGLLSAGVALREYDAGYQALRGDMHNLVLSESSLPFRLLREDANGLQREAGLLVEDPRISTAIVYDATGEQIAVARQARSEGAAPLPFARLRGTVLSDEPGALLVDVSGNARQPNYWSGLLRLNSQLQLSYPIISPVTPGTFSQDSESLSRALVEGKFGHSNWVVGYVHLGVDNRSLVTDALRVSLGTFAISVLVTLLFSGVLFHYTRRLTRPLLEIGAAAQRIIDGDFSTPLQVDGKGEIGDVMRSVNDVLYGVRAYRAEQERDRKQLARKIEESGQQLSERDAALDKAAQEAEQRRSLMRKLANYDRLTQLPNRQLFGEQLALLLRLSLRKKRKLALLFIQIDGYRRINDALGMAAGDIVLREVSRRLSATVRGSDSVGHFFHSNAEIAVSRLGGDEFTVVLNEVESEDAARQVAKRILDQLRLPIDIEGKQIVLRSGVGVAMAPNHGADVDSLLRAASAAKQHALDEGGDTIVFYERAMNSGSEQRLQLESDLRRAIERGELALHYQPQVDTLTGSVVGAEALLRWEHPELGLIPTGDFIKLAEEIGMIEALGDWVLIEACRQVREFNKAGLKLPKVAINVSALQFDAGFVRRISEVVAQQGIPPSQLELALTEGIMTSNHPETVHALSVLKRSGIYLSVDDFGTGYSPLSYLGEYPLDELKLKRKFLLQAAGSENGAKLVIAIIAMARSLGLRVLVTGVETAEQMHFLTDNGAHLAQGYLFSEPVPADDLARMLTPWHFVRKIQDLAAMGAA